MVDSNELMIGNKLQDIDGNIVEIKSITKRPFLYCTGGTIL